MGFPSWEFRGSSMLAAKEGPYNVRNNVMDNDKENIICHWKAQSWGVNVQNDGRRLVLDESACRNADTLLCPVWEIARYLNAARETAKSGGACTTNLVNPKIHQNA
jgi:hypothetical protein